MNPERWVRLEALVADALDLPPERRAGHLREAAGRDGGLRAEAERLLASVERAEGFLEPGPGTSAHADGSPESPRPGDRLGAWELLEEIGRGGMGTVHRARRADGSYEQEVALKILRPGLAGPGLLERFRRERFILARLEHPGIARLIDAGMTGDGRPYLVMERVEGEPIDVHCRRRRISPRRRLGLVLDACQAVQAAHQRLVVHRDLKPSNLLVGRDGAIRLVDFGIAKLVEPETFGLDETQTALLPFTPRYASPEQLRGEAVSVASDVYSLALVLYELLTGRHPFVDGGTAPLAAIEAMLHGRPRPPSQVASPEAAAEMGLGLGALRRLLRGDLDAIVLKALRREPEQRYATAAELAADLRRCLEHRPVLARRGSLRYRLGKFAHRHRLGVGLGSLAGAALLAAAIGLGLQADRLATERNRVVAERDKARHAVRFMEEAFAGVLPERSLGETLTVAEALERSAVRLREDLADQPEVRADLAAAIGRIQRSLGLFEEARPLLRDALDTLETTAPGSVALARAHLDLGRLETAAERHEDARRHLERSRQILEARGQDRTALGAETLHHLGSLRRRIADLSGARTALEQALEIRRERLGEEHPDTARTLSELGIVEGRAGRYREAEATIRRSLAIQDRVLPWNHPDREFNYGTLGIVLGFQGRMEEAGEALAQGTRILESLLPGEHPVLLNSRHNYAVYLANVGRTEEAEAILLDVLEAREKIFEPGSLRLMESSLALAGLYRMTGRLDRAEAHLRQHLRHLQALETSADAPVQLLGSRAELLDALAGIHASRGEKERAAETWRRVVETLDEAPALANNLHVQRFRAIALLELGEVETARPLVRRILDAGLRYGPLVELAARAGLTDPSSP